MNILVAYISKTGTTREIAERIARVFETQGHEVATAILSESGDIGSFDMIVLGSPINGMRFLPEFLSFIAKHAQDLARKRVALFAVSYLHGYGRKMWSRLIERETAKAAASVGTQIMEIFAGRLASKPTGGMAFMFGTPGNPLLDRRDWQSIEAWAHKLSK